MGVAGDGETVKEEELVVGAHAGGGRGVRLVEWVIITIVMELYVIAEMMARAGACGWGAC